MDNWISVDDSLPEDCNDCRVKYEDGTEDIAYYGGGGCKSWAIGVGLPTNGKVIAWIGLGNCDSIEHYNSSWSSKENWSGN